MRLRTVPWYEGAGALVVAEDVVVSVVRNVLMRGKEAGKEVKRKGVPPPSLLELVVVSILSSVVSRRCCAALLAVVVTVPSDSFAGFLRNGVSVVMMPPPSLLVALPLSTITSSFHKTEKDVKEEQLVEAPLVDAVAVVAAAPCNGGGGIST